jgi:8-oxo-dGTP diphosphatase
VVVDRMVGRVYYDPNYDMHHFLFTCRLVNDDARPGADSPEVSEWGFFPIEALPCPISDFTIRRIQDACANVEPGVVEIGPRIWIE